MSTPVTTSINIRRYVSQVERVRFHERGRICSHAGCDTILSIYNPSKYCSAHADEAPGAHRSRRSHAVRTVACEFCGAVFQSKNERRRYCSDRCRMAAFARRRRSAHRAQTPRTGVSAVQSQAPLRPQLVSAVQSQAPLRPQLVGDPK
jgi:hypothetical protein